jgi:predicted dehydrogenase
MYKKYSGGLMAELGSHQISVCNWFFDSAPEAVYASGGIHQYKDGREVSDHIYVTYDYPQGRTVTFSSIQSNKFDHYYEQIMGTKGTLILLGEKEAMLFNEDDGKEANVAVKSTNMEVSKQTSSPVMDASESRRSDAAGRTVAGTSSQGGDSLSAYGLRLRDSARRFERGSR